MSKHERDSVCHDVSFRSLGGFATWCWHCNMNSGDTADQVNSGDTTATKSQVSLVCKKSPLTHLVHPDDHDMRWAGGLTIGQLEMSLDSHYIVTKQSSFPSPFLIAPLPNAIRRPLQSPLFQALLVAVPSRGKWEGGSSTAPAGRWVLFWSAGRPDQGAGSTDTSISLSLLLFWLSFSPFLSFFAASCKCKKCRLLVVDTPSHTS